jgi:hypothetical protein
MKKWLSAHCIKVAVLGLEHSHLLDNPVKAQDILRIFIGMSLTYGLWQVYALKYHVFNVSLPAVPGKAFDIIQSMGYPVFLNYCTWRPP